MSKSPAKGNSASSLGLIIALGTVVLAVLISVARESVKIVSAIIIILSLIVVIVKSLKKPGAKAGAE